MAKPSGSRTRSQRTTDGRRGRSGRAIRILVTGFGPFPGAPDNPTGALVRALARRAPALDDVRVAGYVFATEYAVVDRALPRLLARHRPHALLMFGLAPRSRGIRIETLARNRISPHPDAAGFTRGPCAIEPGAPATLPLRIPAKGLLRAAQRSGVPARLSRSAGQYLCNYLLWRAAASASGGLKLAAFIHVPPVSDRVPLERVAAAAELILRAAAASLRRRR